MTLQQRLDQLTEEREKTLEMAKININRIDGAIALLRQMIDEESAKPEEVESVEA